MDDKILSQTQPVDPGIAHGEAPDSTHLRSIAPAVRDFSLLLERMRNARGLSKADLAKRSGFDPSSITRFEQGVRAPERETVLELASAMTLPVTDRDRLLAAAGFRSELWDDPLLVQLAQALNDERVSDPVRAQVRTVIQMAIVYCQQQGSGERSW